jgi:N-methylhydantoinase A
LPGGVTRVLNLRSTLIGKRPKFDLTTLAPDADASCEAARRGGRRVYVAGQWREADIFQRLKLPVGVTIPGPAILEQPDTTIFIEPGMSGAVDRFGNIILAPQETT